MGKNIYHPLPLSFININREHNPFILLPSPSDDAEHFEIAPFNQTQTIILIVIGVIVILLIGLLIFFILSRPSSKSYIEFLAIKADRQYRGQLAEVDRLNEKLRDCRRAGRGGCNINLRVSGPRSKYVVGYDTKPDKSPYVVDYPYRS